MFKKKKTYLILIIIIAIIGSVFYFSKKKSKTEYSTETIKKGDIVQTVSTTGTLVSPNQVDLSFKENGNIKDILVDVGDSVKSGQRVAMLDAGAMFQSIAAAKDEIKYQKKTLESMKKKDETYNHPDKEAQRYKVKKAEEEYKGLWKSWEINTILKSPIDGIIIKRNNDPGEIAVSGNAVITVASDERLELESNVPESDIVKVAIGQHADVTFDAFTISDIFDGEVTEIDPASTVIQDVVYYKIKLRINNMDDRLKNGMSADLDVKTAEKKNVISIPERAVKEDGGQKYVEILKDENNGITEKVNVKIGMKGDEGMIEITSGLSGEEKVITLSKTQ